MTGGRVMRACHVRLAPASSACIRASAARAFCGAPNRRPHRRTASSPLFGRPEPTRLNSGGSRFRRACGAARDDGATLKQGQVRGWALPCCCAESRLPGQAMKAGEVFVTFGHTRRSDAASHVYRARRGISTALQSISFATGEAQVAIREQYTAHNLRTLTKRGTRGV
jgi:hypothetical protein